MKSAFPTQVELLPDEVYEINLARLMLTLRKTDAEIEAVSLQAIWNVLGAMEFDAEQERERLDSLKP